MLPSGIESMTSLPNRFQHEFVPLVGRPNPTGEHRCQPSWASADGLSLSFPNCCEVHCLGLARGTHDAKGVRFDCVHPSQPYLELCRTMSANGLNVLRRGARRKSIRWRRSAANDEG